MCSFLDVAATTQAALTSSASKELPTPLLSVSGAADVTASEPLALHIHSVSVRVPVVIAADKSTAEGAEGSEIARLQPAVVTASRPLFISGLSGAGKTSALRILAGLWPVHSEAPPSAGPSCSPIPAPLQTVFVPTLPRLLGGATLAQNLAYPHLLVPCDEDLTAALRACELEHLVPVLHEERADWASSLSGGELQRLMAARVWLQRPAFAFFDEGLTAVDAPVRQRVMGALQAQGVGCVFVSHDLPALRGHHDINSNVSRRI